MCPCGFIMVTDSKTEEGEDKYLGVEKELSLDAKDKADPPEPFKWTPPGHPDTDGGVTTQAKKPESGDNKNTAEDGSEQDPKYDTPIESY